MDAGNALKPVMTRTAGHLPAILDSPHPPLAAGSVGSIAGRLGSGVSPGLECVQWSSGTRSQDWEAIYPFFSAVVAAGETYAYPENLSFEDARAYWMAEPPGRTIAAVDHEVVVGSATMGPNRPGRGSHFATASFMVDPVHQGRGVGRAFGLHVADWARASDYRSIPFNAVVETNHPAVHLWQDLGFEIVATVPESFQPSPARLRRAPPDVSAPDAASSGARCSASRRRLSPIEARPS